MTETESRRDDGQLVGLCLGGDREAFNALVARHYRGVYNMIYRMIGNAEDASDLTQETFLRVYTRLDTFDPEQSFLAWIRRIGTNLCIDRLRRRREATASLDQHLEAGAQYADERPGVAFVVVRSPVCPEGQRKETAMRRTLLTLMAAASLMTAAGLVNAQTETAKKPEPATAVEKFMARRGRLIIKDFYEVGTVRSNLIGKLEVKLLVLSAPGATAAEKVFGAKFERPAVERYESDAASFLDFDETTAALDALVFMRDLGAKMAGEDHEYTEAIYETRGGMRIGFFQKDRKQTAFVEVGGPIGGKHVFMGMDGLNELENLLRQAITRLKDLGAK